MMTEQEARQRWCPFSRYSVYDKPSSNRWKQSAPESEPHALNPIPCRCIASDCMAWRWHDEWQSATEEGVGGDLVVRLKRKQGEPKLGYCGLAGAHL